MVSRFGKLGSDPGEEDKVSLRRAKRSAAIQREYLLRRLTRPDIHNQGLLACFFVRIVFRMNPSFINMHFVGPNFLAGHASRTNRMADYAKDRRN